MNHELMPVQGQVDVNVMQHTPGPWATDNTDALLVAAAPAMAYALDLIVRRLQADIDDGSRPDQWSMDVLVQKAKAALPDGWRIGEA